MSQTDLAPGGSIIIPAYNEASGIARCLSALMRDARPGEFDIVVVCNGCTDDTARIARGFGESVRVLELAEGNKTAALNAGNEAALHFPRLYLDGDLELSTQHARELLAKAGEGRWFAAVGRMELDLSGASMLLRNYYAVWALNGYLARGKFGGAYALSREGVENAGQLPRVINDDEFVRRKIPAEKICFLPHCFFTAKAPATFRDLYKVRRRVHRGNRQLAAMGIASKDGGGTGGVVSAALKKPGLWAGLAAYAAVNALARRASRRETFVWERDESSRAPVAGRT